MVYGPKPRFFVNMDPDYSEKKYQTKVAETESNIPHSANRYVRFSNHFGVGKE